MGSYIIKTHDGDTWIELPQGKPEVIIKSPSGAFSRKQGGPATANRSCGTGHNHISVTRAGKVRPGRESAEVCGFDATRSTTNITWR